MSHAFIIAVHSYYAEIDICEEYHQNSYYKFILLSMNCMKAMATPTAKITNTNIYLKITYSWIV